VLYSFGVIAFLVWFTPGFMKDAPREGLTASELQWSLAVLASWAAESLVNLWLQLRGLFPSRPRVAPIYRSLYEPLPSLLPMLHRQSEMIDRLTLERDQLAREIERLASQPRGNDLAAFAHIVGGRRMVLAPLHPDREKDEAKKAVLTARFQQVSALLERAGVR
jgi:hypothetical protein